MPQSSQRSFFLLALVLTLLGFCQQASADLSQEYCSDINTSGNAKNTSIFQSNGLCYTFCNGYAFAIVQYQGCWCSNYIPVDTTDTSDCSVQCPGYPPESCGNAASGLYGYVALPANPSGTAGAGGAAVSSTTTKSPPTSTSSTVTVTQNPVTIVQTITATPTLDPDQSSSTSTTANPKTTTTSSSSTSSTWTPTPIISLETVTGQVRTVTVIPTVPPNSGTSTEVTKSPTASGLGIGGAVGLTVGLVALATILSGIIWFCLRKRREEKAASEYNDMASHRGSSAGIGSAGPIPSRTMSENSRYVLGTDGRRVVETWENPETPGSRRSRLMPVDPRLDPFSPVYQRGLVGGDNKSRESINTIRDDHDYSRRVHQQAPILRATNPDEHTDD